VRREERRVAYSTSPRSDGIAPLGASHLRRSCPSSQFLPMSAPYATMSYQHCLLLDQMYDAVKTPYMQPVFAFAAATEVRVDRDPVSRRPPDGCDAAGAMMQYGSLMTYA